MEDNNSVFQQSRRANLFWRHPYRSISSGGVPDQLVEPFYCGRHAYHNRNRRKLVLFATQDEFLHDGGGATCLYSSHAAMSFVDDKVQLVCLLVYCVGQCFPNGVLPVVGVLGKVAAAAQFLCVEEIDVSLFQHLAVKRVIADYLALAHLYPVCLCVYLLLRLKV